MRADLALGFVGEGQKHQWYGAEAEPEGDIAGGRVVGSLPGDGRRPDRDEQGCDEEEHLDGLTGIPEQLVETFLFK